MNILGIMGMSVPIDIKEFRFFCKDFKLSLIIKASPAEPRYSCDKKIIENFDERIFIHLYLM